MTARINFVRVIIMVIFLFLGLGILNIEVIRGARFRDLSNKNRIRLLPQQGNRGRLLDRHGNAIVDNYLSYDVMASSIGKRPQEALAQVAKVLDVDLDELKNRLPLSYASSFMPTALARNIDIKKAIALEEMKPDLDNIMIQPYPLRHYPHGRLASHVIGYLNEIDRWRLTRLANYGYKTKDIVGFGGVEEKYDYYLRQEEGGLSVEVDHRGKLVNVLGFRQPVGGKDIQLTLDLKIQKIIEDSLETRNGSIILMDPYNGEIIAMASSPDFNPSIFVKKSDAAIASLLRDPGAPMLNRAISGLYPAGSVFKVVVAAAALETKKINLSSAFYCTGSTFFGKQEFSCWEKHGQENLTQAIAHSCNIFFYRTGILTGAQNIYDYAVKFGFSRASGIDLPNEANGSVPSPLLMKVSRFRNWFDGDTANLAIGQGDLLVTPLQVARMMAVFANKGALVAPYVVKAIDGKDISRWRKKTVRLSLKDSTINYIRQGLRSVVSDPNGTGNVLANLPVSVAGKTGTAQVSRGLAHGWFAGFFPFQEPKFVICVFLEHGGSGHASCVVAKQIIETMANEGLI